MIAEMMTDDMRATARRLADAAREAEPAMLKILLFPSANEIRLLYVDRPSPNNRIDFDSAIALIRPEEEGHLDLPAGWGTWKDAEVLWEKA